MLMSLFNSIDLIGCGGDINQSESCKGCVRHIRWWGKNQDFMLIRLFNSIDLIGLDVVGTLTNQKRCT